MSRTLSFLIFAFACAFPSAAQIGTPNDPLASDLGGNPSLGSGVKRFGAVVPGGCTYAIEIWGGGEITFYIVNYCTGQVETYNAISARSKSNNDSFGLDVQAGLSPFTTSPTTPALSPGSEGVTSASLGGGSQLVAWVTPSALSIGTIAANTFTIQTAGHYNVGPNAEHVIAADFNGDGIADLAVSNFGSLDTNLGGNISIFLGAGGGTFIPGATVNAGATPVAMYAADFNGDGELDLAVANVTATNISILLGNGNGTFQAPVPYSVEGSPQSIVAADFNGDGHLDLAVTNYEGGISVLLGNGNGTFQAAQSFSSGNGKAIYLVSMDLNGDGKADLAVADPDSSGISFLFGNGNGTFQAPQEYATGSSPQYFALIPESGQAELATIDRITGDLCFMQVFSNGVAGAPPMYAVPHVVTGVAAGDLNGDGFPDIVAADQSISVLQRIPGGGFSPAVNYPLQSGSQPVAVVVADINGDGKNDVVAASTGGPTGGTLDIALNSGNGTLGAQSSYALGGNPGGFEGSVPSGIAIGDFNGDDKPDVAAGYQASDAGVPGGVSVLINNGGGTMNGAVNYPVSTFSVYCTIAGDFNGDGKLDLAACAGLPYNNISSPGALAVFLGKGDGTFQNATLIQVGSPAGTPVAVAAGDVNRDGKLDLVVSAVDSNFNDTIVVLLGNGDGTFRQLAPISTIADGSALALADFNGDGILDLAVGDCCGVGGAVYLLGSGDGTFQAPQPFSAGASINGFAVTDWNATGIAGLAIAQKGGTVEAMEGMLDPKLYSGAPALTITKSHTGNFSAGQQGATYSITVANGTNGANVAPTSGPVTVTDALPSGLTLVSMAGAGWTCAGSACTRSEPLTAGYSYPTITVTVNVAANAQSPQVNMASVSGGGSAAAATTDTTTIGNSCVYTLFPPPPMPPVPSGAGNGSVTVTTANGCPWTTSSDSSWLTITSPTSQTGDGTVNYSVAAYSGATQRTGTLTVAGQAFPVTQLPPPVLTISSSHSGNFFLGQTGAVYVVTVTDTAGTSAAAGGVSVMDAVPTGLTLVSMTGSGWSCQANTCVRTDTLPPGLSYPPITISVNVAPNAPPSVTNQATVTGGGSAPATANDVTTIQAPTCSFTLGSTNAIYTQAGTASPGGVLPEVPVTVRIVPGAGTNCALSYNFSSSASWLSGTQGTAGFTYIALTNPHPTSRTAILTVTNQNGGSATFTVTEAGDSEPLLNRQVRALYQSVLGRDPDPSGFAFWTGVGSAGLGQMLDSFLTSPEAFNSDFAVMATYVAATGVAPTYAQFVGAVAGVRAGLSLSALFNSLIPAGYTVHSLYQNLLQRAPLQSEVTSANAAGLTSWFQTLIGYPSNVTPVGGANNEFQSTGIYHTDHTNGLYIAMLYFVILGRDLDPGGYTFWVGVANSGGSGILFQGPAGYLTRIQILGPGTPNQGFAGSPEFQGLYQ